MGVCDKGLFCHVIFGKGVRAHAKKAAGNIRRLCLLMVLCLPLSAFSQTITDYDGTFNIVWSVTGTYNGGTFAYVTVTQTSPAPATTVGGGSTTTGQVTLTRPNGTYIYNINACYANNAPPQCHVDSTRTVIVDIVSDPPASAPATFNVPASDSDGSYSISWSTVTNAATYELQEQTNGGSWSAIQNTSATSRAISGKGNGSYGYQVRACNPIGCSAFTAIKITDVALAPGVPGSINITPNPSTGNVTVSWGSATGSITEYDLDYQLGSGGWTNAYNGTLLSASFSSLAVGNYNIQVRACKTTGSYSNCSGWRAGTFTIMVPPPIPSGLTTPAGDGDGGFTVSWSAASTATSYELQEQTDGGSYSTIQNSSAVSRTVSGKGNGSYGYRVRACNAVGCSAYSSVVTTHVAITPGVPASISVSPNPSSGNVTVSWGAATGSISAYDLDYQLGSGSWTNAYNGTLLSASLSNLAVGSYNIQVRACKTTGSYTNCSSWRAGTFTIMLPPATPAGLTAPGGDGDGAFTVSWNAASTATSYELQEQTNGGSFSTIQNTSATSKAISGKGNGSYGYRVRACNAVGCSAYSTVVTTHVAVAPGVPGALNLSIGTNGSSVALTWTAGSGSVTNYELQQRFNSGSWSTVYTGASLAHTSSNLGGGDYEYQVRACKATGSYSNCSGWRTSGIGSVPGVSNGQPIDSDSYTFSASWNSGYNTPSNTIEYLDTDGSFTLSWPDGPASYNEYYEFIHNAPTGPGWTYGGLSYNYTALPDGLYSFTLIVNFEYESNEYENWTNALKIRVRVQKAPPPAPSTLNVPETSGNGIYTVSWASSANATSYVLEEKIGNGVWAPVTLSPPTQTSKAFSGKTSNSYSYRVKACIAGTLCSASTDPQTVDVAIAPGVPSSLTVAPALNDGDLTVSWGAASGSVTSYELDQKYNGGAWNIIYVGGALSASINDLASGNYQYQVRACRSSGSYKNCSNSTASQSAIAAAPAVPVLNAPPQSMGSHTIAWDVVLNTNEYRLEERFNGGVWAIIYQGGNTSYPTTRPQGQYQYRVSACNDLGCAVSQIATLDVIGPPGVPGAINGPATDDDGMYGLNWGASTGVVAEYQLEERYNGGAWDIIYTGAATADTVTVSQVGSYDYRVLARNALGESAYTAIKTVTVTINSSGTVNDPVPPVLATPPAASSNEILATDQVLSTKGEFDVSSGGQASYDIRILTAPAGGNYVPKISLSYNSGGGNGLVGLGWSLSGIGGISRCRQTEGQDKNAAPISWNESDRFCLNGERLLVVTGSYGAPGSAYKTEIDSYARITAIGGTLGRPDHFKVEQKDGTIHFYGEAADSKYSLAANKVLTWALSSSQDSAGNRIEYSYANDSSGHRIVSVDYAFDAGGGSPVASLEFTYENRSDPISGYLAGHSFITGKRLKSIESRNNGIQVRKYNLFYDQGAANTPNDKLSRLTSVEECVNTACLRPTVFEWAIPAPQLSALAGGMSFAGGVSDYRFGDINGDGLTDIVWLEALERVLPMQNNYWHPRPFRYALGQVDANGNFSFVPTPFDDGSFISDDQSAWRILHLADFNGDGRSDVSMGAGVYLSKPQTDGSWRLAQTPVSLFAGVLPEAVSYLDVDGDGMVDQLTWQAEKPWMNYYSGTGYYGNYSGFRVNRLKKAQNGDSASSQYFVASPYEPLLQYMPETAHIPSNGDATMVASPPADYYLTDSNGQMVENRLHLAPIYALTGLNGEFNGDGRVDVIAHIYESHGACYQDNEFDGCESMWTVPAIFTTGPRYQGGIELKYHSYITGMDIENGTAVDLNGDGLSDLVWPRAVDWAFRVNRGSSMGDVVAINVPARPFNTYNKANTDSAVADWNGDGYPDFIWHSPSGSFNSNTTGNGPGSVKVRYWDPANNAFDSAEHVIASVGYSIQTSYTDDRYEWNFAFGRFKASPAIRVMDVNADGKPDLVTTPETQGGNIGVFLNIGGTASENKIIRITKGLAETTEIEYEPITKSEHYRDITGINSNATETICQSVDEGQSCWQREIAKSSSASFYSAINDPWQVLPSETQNLGTPQPVLSAYSPLSIVTRVQHHAPSADLNIEQQIDAGAKRTLSYYYERARIQAGGRGFLGFKEYSVVDHQTGLRTVSKLRQDWPFIGTAWKTEVRTQSNHLLRETWNRWGFVNCYDGAGNPDNGCDDAMRNTLESGGSAALGSLKLFLRESESKTYALLDNGAGQGAQLSREINRYLQDGLGNTVKEQSTTYAGQSALVLDKVTTNAYTYAGTAWSLQQGRMSRMDVASSNGVETINRSSSFTYYTSGDAIGLLKTETIEPDQPAYTVTTTHLYDGFGNKVQSSVVADGQTRSSRVEYDNYGRYVDKTYELFSGNVERLVNQVIARDSYGKPTTLRSYIDSSQYITSITATSAFGIPYFSADSSGAWSLTTAGRQDESPQSLCPATTVTWNRVETAGGGESLACQDVRGRTLRKATRLFDGSWSVVDSEYDSLDRTIRTSEPYVPGMQSVYWTENKNHDRLGRVRLIEHPDETQTTIIYNGYTTEITNARLQTRKETINPLGQKVKVVDPLNGETLFSYDPRGNLKTMTDPAGNTTLIGYDLRDRKISMSDPDKGNWSYRYNRFNELTCQKDGRNQLIVQSYDLRGRAVNRVDYQADSGNSCDSPEGAVESNVTWSYDSAAYGLGKLDSVVDIISDYEKEITYDSLGRVSRTRTTLRGYNNQLGDHFEKLTYDQFGRPFQVFDAARNTDSFDSNGIEYEYNAYGHLHKLKNAVVSGSLQETYYEVEQMDARGNVTQAAYGNGVTRGAGYDDQTGRALSLNASTPQGYLQNLELEWDEVGNLEYRHETGLGKGLQARDLYEDFEYDAMNRLTHSSLTGDYTESITVTYDGIGNITSKTGVGSYSYNPSGPGSVRPHAVIETIGAVTTTYSYDNNGNQTGDSGGRTISYTVADLPQVITKGGHTTEFFYGPDRARYKRIDTKGSSSTTTLYLGSVEKVYNPDNTIHWKREIAGIALITQTFSSSGTQTGSDTRYLVKDHLGTLSLILDNTGAVVEELYFDAWGKRREILLADTIDIFNKPITTRGYTSHEMLDAVGLIHMNGRIYDGNLSRFVQADPIIQDPFKTESLNRYSYVWNNPLNATDPSGFEVCADGGSVQCAAERDKDKQVEEQQRKVTPGKGACSSGKCQNYAVKDNKGNIHEVSINKSDVKAFEKEMSKEIKKGKEDMKNGISYSSLTNSSWNTNTGDSSEPAAPATARNNNPVASGGGAIRAAVGDKFAATNVEGWRPSDEYSGGETTVVAYPHMSGHYALRSQFTYWPWVDKGAGFFYNPIIGYWSYRHLSVIGKTSAVETLNTISSVSNISMMIYPKSAVVAAPIGAISDVGVALIESDGEELLPALMGQAVEIKLKQFGVSREARTRTGSAAEEFLNYLDD